MGTAAVAVLLGSCTPAPPPLTMGDLSLSGKPLTGTALTTEAGDSFHAAASGDSIRVDSPATNRGINTRMIFWTAGSKAKVDGESCARFDQNSTWPTQEGVALRISQAGGHTTAVTVTKNIFYGGSHHYNVHTWNDSTFTMRASFDMRESLVGSGDVNLCARLNAQVLVLKVWRSSNPEPRWEDKNLVRAVRLTDAPTGAGEFGVYAGHLPPNSSVTVTPFTS